MRHEMKFKYKKFHDSKEGVRTDFDKPYVWAYPKPIKVRDIHINFGSIKKVVSSPFDIKVGMSHDDHAQYILQTKYRLIFEKTGNSMAAWRVFHIFRRNNWEIPDWVLNYLDETAIKMAELETSDPENLSVALNMKKERGGSTHAKSLDANLRELSVAYKFHILKRRGIPERKIHDELESEFGCKASTVKSIWNKYRALLGWPARLAPPKTKRLLAIDKLRSIKP